MAQFRQKHLLHIEDDEMWQNELADVLRCSEKMREFYRGQLGTVTSRIDREVPEVDDLRREIERIVREASDQPTIIQIVSGQVARGYLSEYVPGCIISDTNFPMNGAQTVKWLATHGFEGYPLIGLSTTDIPRLDPVIAHFFMTTNARYFEKGQFGKQNDALVEQIIFNVEWAGRMYGKKEKDI